MLSMPIIAVTSCGQLQVLPVWRRGIMSPCTRSPIKAKCVSRNWGRYGLKGIPWSAREKAKTWAYAHLNRPYKKQFWNNKKIEDTHYNCSQFVWAAYKISGYDLDSDGGPGVYPDDIRNSRYLVHY